MKSFKHYLAESVRTYKYRVKIAGDITQNFTDLFVYNLDKFQPVKIVGPKSTPIQKDPYGFPGLENQAIHIFDCEFRYPATEPMIQQIALMCGHNINGVRMITTAFDDSINDEVAAYANQESHTPLLDHPELEDNGKQASKEYGEQYLPRIMKDKGEVSNRIVYAAPKTPTAPNYTNDVKNQGIKSPMTQISRPAKPATGSR